jgi:hemerythrin superfamily protein
MTLLKADHQTAEALLARFDTTDVSGRDGYFCELVHTLVGHEVAEELVVYPAVRDAAPDGGRVADARLSEQAEAERVLADMEGLDSSTGEFVAKMYQLRDAVLAHASAEESTAFRILEAASTPEQRMELGDRYEKAKAKAPTHPHPHAPDTPPGNKLLGPIAALFDRARDAVHRA